MLYASSLASEEIQIEKGLFYLLENNIDEITDKLSAVQTKSLCS